MLNDQEQRTLLGNYLIIYFSESLFPLKMALPGNQETNPILYRYLFSKQRAVYGKAKLEENIIYAEVKLFSSKETAEKFRSCLLES